MSLLSQLSGTLINTLTVLIGASLGLLLGSRLPAKMQRTLLQTLSLVVLYIALGMAGSLNTVRAGPVPGVIVALIALALGAVIGEALGLEERLAHLGDSLKRRMRGEGKFTEGFVAATLLFCVGPLTLVGGIQNGLTGDSSTYVLKAALDCIASIALAGVYGVGVLVSAAAVFVIQGSIALAAGALAGLLLGGADPATLNTNPYVLVITGAGGLIILGIAWNLMLAGLGFEEDRRVRVASLLPALVVGPLLLWGIKALGL